MIRAIRLMAPETRLQMPYGRGDIVLVNPSGGWETDTDGTYFFPIGLLYLQNYLHRHGIPSSILDTHPTGISPDEFKKIIRADKPRIVGFTGSPFERHQLHQYIEGVKDGRSDSMVVVGGPYFTATDEDCLRALPDVDVVVRGEGEETLLDLVTAFDNGANLDSVRGITYRAPDGRIVRNRNRRPSDRDECEIDLEHIRNDDTYNPFVVLKNFEEEGIQALPILLSRGCTKRCTFCFNNNHGRFRSRSVGSIVDEVKAKRERFGCDSFWMVDPTFTLRKDFAAELCRAFLEHCPGIKWYCETRADCDLDLLSLMAEAGCVSIDFALESGSPKVLKAIRKDLDPACVADFAGACSDLSIRALVFVMYSLPEETAEDFKQTMSVLRSIRSDVYNISSNTALVLPGTQMEREARQSGIIPESFSWYDSSFPDIPEWRSHMSESEVAFCREWLEDYQYRLHHPDWRYGLRRARRLRARAVNATVGIVKDRPSLMNALNRRPRLLETLKGAARILRAG